jgi:hypothetical protein
MNIFMILVSPFQKVKYRLSIKSYKTNLAYTIHCIFHIPKLSEYLKQRVKRFLTKFGHNLKMYNKNVWHNVKLSRVVEELQILL